MSRRRRAADEPETIKTVRENLLKAVSSALNAVEQRASKDGEGDAEAALLYAQAASALMGSELAKELFVGREGFKTAS